MTGLPTEPAQLPDAVLIARVERGETECFAEIARRYQSALGRVALSRLGRADWAEDVVQETFLAALRSAASYDPRFSFRTWLWTILLNQCHAHYRRRMRSVPLEPLSADCEPACPRGAEAAGESPLGRLLAAERTAQLEELLVRLPLAQADALRLRFFGGLKFQEIADAMQCSLNTAKNRVRCGLVQMAEWMAAGVQGDARRRWEPERAEP
jgi:RNA polymerase sigma-70 factor (ECF subfamily)